MLGMVVLTIGLLMLDSSEPRPIDWTPTFARTDKVPFGAYILYESLPAAVGDSNRTVVTLPIYNVLSKARTTKTTYFFLNSSFDGDYLDVERLLKFASRGNTVFIAAEEFPYALEDTLQFSTDGTFSVSDSSVVNLVNPALRGSKDYSYPAWMCSTFFSEFDTARTTVLGTDLEKNCNYLRIEFGEGAFYLSTLPYAFTNYNLVDTLRSSYAISALSYLPKQPLLWDEYYKAGKEVARQKEEYVVESPLRYVLGRKELRAALYLLLGMLLLFVFFAAKRRQRIIPVIHRPQNTSLEFARTVGRLYYQHGDHRSIAEKMIGYFLEYVRSTFSVDTSNRAGEFRTILSRRSGVDRATVERVFSMIDFVSMQVELGEEDLDDLNTAIEKFHEQAMG